MFSKGNSFFVLFVCFDRALNLHLHLVALPVSMTMSWPTKFQQFWSECFFKFCLVYFLLFTNALFNWHFQSPCVPLVFWEMENNILVLFFVWNLQTIFSLKAMFSECPLFFLLFVCNDGALNLHLQVLALSASVTMSWPTKSTYKLNMSGLDFLALVLQSSKSFDMNAFSSFV